ncbi:MAG: hypothetical protein ACREKS_04215 [Candidatus Rokuibacteriota bacterium]
MAFRSNLSVRSYELATLAAARALRSSYCSLAHGRVLADKVFDAADVDALKAHGYRDEEIFDLAAAAAARCFFSKLLDARGVEADSSFNDLEPPLRQALTVGRPVADHPRGN